MRNAQRFGIVVAAMLLAASAGAAEPRIGKFVAYELPDFTILTTRSGDQARQFMDDLAKFRVTLEKTLGKRAAKSGVRTLIVIVSSSDWEKYLQPRPNIAGYFQQGRFVNYMVMNGDVDRGEALHVMFHEYTHYYLASQFAGEYPPWFNEGLAELMGAAKFSKGMAVLQVPMYRVREARDSDWIPFDRLIRVDQNSPEYQQHQLADSFYSQAWLAVHYGLVENRDFGRQMLTFLAQINSLHPFDEAAKNAFGDLGVIDKELRDYSRNTSMASGGLQLGDVPAVTLPAGQPVAELDALGSVIDLMLATRSAPARIRPLVESLSRREPKSARSAIFAARLALAENDDAAFDKSVAEAESLLTADDLKSRRDLAVTLLTSALDTSPTSKRSTEQTENDLKRAMRLFGEAIARDSNDVEALWGFGTAATRLDRNLDLAEQALLAAYQREPASDQIAMSLANLKGRQDKPDEMIRYLKDTIHYATNVGTRRWATEQLESMQKYIDERDKADAENRKQREDYEKKMADYEKKYGKPKKKAGG